MSNILYFVFIGAISIAAMAIYTYLFPASPYWQRLGLVFFTACSMQIFIRPRDPRNL